MADNPATTKRPTAEALKIAEAYYMVARDLEQNAHQQLDIARRLNTYADWLCEQNARQDSAGASRDE